jgi:hypothetical protein
MAKETPPSRLRGCKGKSRMNRRRGAGMLRRPPSLPGRRGGGVTRGPRHRDARQDGVPLAGTGAGTPVCPGRRRGAEGAEKSTFGPARRREQAAGKGLSVAAAARRGPARAARPGPRGPQRINFPPRGPHPDRHGGLRLPRARERRGCPVRVGEAPALRGSSSSWLGPAPAPRAPRSPSPARPRGWGVGRRAPPPRESPQDAAALRLAPHRPSPRARRR